MDSATSGHGANLFWAFSGKGYAICFYSGQVGKMPNGTPTKFDAGQDDGTV
jgi:hypothetical protein